ncbi:hypothetical protein ACC764_01230 [Rhizobium ruizarguesonis]|uniref:hypothetical protein n=1 Tax=Rhizobium ruizarguesonis TaxID=2081791 RepID=UPI001FDF3B71|nr:hypothetical protein [Rhizobium ruizarguesonis]
MPDKLAQGGDVFHCRGVAGISLCSDRSAWIQLAWRFLEGGDFQILQPGSNGRASYEEITDARILHPFKSRLPLGSVPKKLIEVLKLPWGARYQF